MTTARVEEGATNIARGQLTVVDHDHDQPAFVAETVTGTFGSLSITAEGQWAYTLDEGADAFVFLDVRETGDLITDFLPGVDKIGFSTFNAGGGQHVFNKPVAASHFSAGHDLIWFSSGGATVILGDTDGDFSTAELTLTIQGSVPLTSGDLLL